MATITEDYVSFEIAKLLKEKGFDAKCDKCCVYFADDDIRVLNLKYPKSAQLLIEDRYPCVTIQMAMKWLREVHNIFIQITVDFSDGAYPMYDVCVVDLARCTSIIINGYNRYSCEEAIKAGIKHCLENLI